MHPEIKHVDSFLIGKANTLPLDEKSSSGFWFSLNQKILLKNKKLSYSVQFTYSLVPQSDFKYLNSANPLLFNLFPLRGLFKRFVFTVQIRFLLSPFFKKKKSHCLVLRPLWDPGGCRLYCESMSATSSCLQGVCF